MTIYLSTENLPVLTAVFGRSWEPWLLLRHLISAFGSFVAHSRVTISPCATTVLVGVVRREGGDGGRAEGEEDAAQREEEEEEEEEEKDGGGRGEEEERREREEEEVADSYREQTIG